MKISIIIPTYNESRNIKLLIESLKKTLISYSFEIIFVDDNSPDKTFGLIKEISKKDNKIRCIRRINRRGLSSAVIEGALSSSAEYLIVMDADMQHDESIIPLMIDTLEREKLDLVVASRFTEGSTVKNFSFVRNLISKVGNYLARKITGVSLKDSMSGFFLIKRNIFDNVAENLSGIGFKILLDIFSASKKDIKYKEVSFKFRERNAGSSKLDSLVIWEFLLLLWDSKLGFIIPARFISFCIIGSLGLIIHIISLMVFNHFDISFLFSQTFSTFIAMTFNFFMNNTLTYRDVRKKGFNLIKGLFLFYIICGVGAIANIGVANALFIGKIPGSEGLWYLSGIFGALVGVIWNFVMSSLITWKIK